MASKVWTPVKGPVIMEFAEGYIAVFREDSAYTFGAEHPYPKEYKLCELVDAPPTVPPPDEVREAIETLLSWREHGKAYDTVRTWLEGGEE